jgi:YjbE family integral membrane protein
LLGTGVAIGLRIVFAFIISYLLGIPFLKVVGGVLLFWVAWQLLTGHDSAHQDLSPSDTMWKAVRTIAVADAVMSLDNVLALAAASKGNMWLFTLGILLTIPLIIYGSQLVLRIIERFPIVVWLGAALLGWIGGELIAADPGLIKLLGFDPSDRLGAIIGAGAVVVLGFIGKRRAASGDS